MGRYKVSSDKRKVQQGFSIRQSMLEWLWRTAEERDTSLSDIANEALEEYRKRRERHVSTGN